jgi:hypothetical protein
LPRQFLETKLNRRCSILVTVQSSVSLGVVWFG